MVLIFFSALLWVAGMILGVFCVLLLKGLRASQYRYSIASIEYETCLPVVTDHVPRISIVAGVLFVMFSCSIFLLIIGLCKWNENDDRLFVHVPRDTSARERAERIQRRYREEIPPSKSDWSQPTFINSNPSKTSSSSARFYVNDKVYVDDADELARIVEADGEKKTLLTLVSILESI
jgi:hypothetical protein